MPRFTPFTSALSCSSRLAGTLAPCRRWPADVLSRKRGEPSRHRRGRRADGAGRDAAPRRHPRPQRRLPAAAQAPRRCRPTKRIRSRRNVEGAAVQVAGGGYCYGGPHPAPGGGWEAITTPHTHNYAPFDLRLFSQREGCYYFIGDPRDFGYTGQIYNYYGAHPVADAYGGGWCFMVGGHYHWWRPWSPYFTVVGPWYYWDGPYDPFFWSYWPYYSFYYRSYYPSYYAGGRYYRNGYRVAPPITRVPPTGWRGTPPAGAARRRPGGGWRGSAAAATQTSPLRVSGSPARGGWQWRSAGRPAAAARLRPAAAGAAAATADRRQARRRGRRRRLSAAAARRGASPRWRLARRSRRSGGGWHGGCAERRRLRGAPAAAFRRRPSPRSAASATGGGFRGGRRG